MPFLTRGGLDAWLALVTTIPTVQGDVNRGVPEEFPAEVSAYVAVGLPNVVRETTGGLIRLESIYFIGFGYAVDGAEGNAENDLADTLDYFVAAVEADPTMGGRFEPVSWVSPGTSSPQYDISVGLEYRHIRFAMRCHQRQTIPRNF